MATFRAAVKIRPGGLLRALCAHSRGDGEARPFLLARCSPAFHRLLKNAYSAHTGIQTSCRGYSSTTTNPVTGTEPPPPPVKETDMFDELISGQRIIEHHLKKWMELVALVKHRGKQFNMGKIKHEDLKEVVKFSLLSTSSPDFRYQCLIILLTQSEDLEETEAILKQTVDDVMGLPIKVIVDIIQLLSSAAKTPLRESVKKDLVLAAVNKRWYELGARNVVFFMYQLDELFDMKKISAEIRKLQKTEASRKVGKKTGDPTTAETDVLTPGSPDSTPSVVSSDSSVSTPSVMSMNLEARTISVAGELKVKDLSRVILLLGKWRSRNEPLLNAVLHRLSQDELSDFTYIQLYNVLFACSVLRLHNDAFFTKLSSRLCTIQPPSVMAACGVLSSMSFLRWRDLELILATLDYLSDKAAVMTTREANNVVTSLSNLYPVPFEEKHAQLVIDLCNKVYGAYPKEPEQISVAYSLAVLLLLSGELADSVLNSDFVQRVMTDTTHSQHSLLNRLAQINMAAKREVKDYQGSLLTDKELEQVEQPKPSQEVATLTTALLKTVGCFANLTNYVRSPEGLPRGVQVAAVMCANASGVVLPLSALDDTDRTEAVHRLALLVVPYAAVTSPDQIPVGSQQMNGRLLQHLGYTPVFILYSDIRPNNSPAESVNNIKQKIMAAVKEQQSTQEVSHSADSIAPEGQ